jgi:hypothetical protein
MQDTLVRLTRSLLLATVLTLVACNNGFEFSGNGDSDDDYSLEIIGISHTTGLYGETLEFSPIHTRRNFPDSRKVRYLWRFGALSDTEPKQVVPALTLAEPSTSTEENPKVTIVGRSSGGTMGIYQITLVVSEQAEEHLKDLATFVEPAGDGDPLTAIRTFDFLVRPPEPVVEDVSGSGMAAGSGSKVKFKALVQNIPDGVTPAYEWDFGGGISNTAAKTQEVEVKLGVPRVEPYTGTVTLSYEENGVEVRRSKAFTFTVQDLALKPVVDITAPPGALRQLSISATAGGFTSVTWNTPPELTVTDSTKKDEGSITVQLPASAGEYSVTATAKNAADASAAVTFKVIVAAP